MCQSRQVLLVAARTIAGPAIDERGDLVAAHADVVQRAVVQGVEEVDGCPPARRCQ